MELLKERIKCDKFLTIINKSLKVGYVDPVTNETHKSKIGIPQGSVLSPLLANIVLHELDKYLIETIIPEYTKGKRRKTYSVYNKLTPPGAPQGPPGGGALKRYSQKKGERGILKGKESEEALKQMRMIPRMDPYDPNYRRAMYIRYADDFVFLLEGSKAEARKIKNSIRHYLVTNCGLELSKSKTLITNLKEGFSFLGANIKKLKEVGFRMKTKTKKNKPITMRAHVRLRLNMPTKQLLEKLITNGFAKRNHLNKITAKPLTSLINLDHTTIIQFYNSKVNGLLNYYSFAGNRIEIQNLV